MELGFFLVVSYILSALKSSLEQQKLTARTDHLTGIPNRRCFYDLAALEMNISRRYQHPFTVIYIDIDNFKTVNDTLGHSAGDSLLRLVSATIRDNIRTADIVARLGGDEFALLLPESGSEAAQAAIRKVRKSLEDVVQSNWPVTFSIGMVTYLKPPPTVDEMIKRADDLMYSVKDKGKDMVRHEIADDSVPG
jgi:diguanylate cyclase (GGDEF)-like protein